MNKDNEALSRLAAAAAAFIMAISWSVMTLAGAYNHSLTRMDNSYFQGFAALYLLGDIEGAVERLDTDQRAFLTTDDPRFVDGVWSSVVVLDRSLELLKNAAVRKTIPADDAARLSGAIKLALKTVADCDDLRDARGKRAAAVFFDLHQSVMEHALTEAATLKTAIIRDIAGRSRNARQTRELLKAMFYARTGDSGPGARFNPNAGVP